MMKRLIFQFIGILLTLSSFGQQGRKEQNLTQAEQFGVREGALIERQLVDVGAVKRIEVKVLLLKDLISGLTKTALQFEYDYASSFSQETKVANLDADEIDGLIKSIEELRTNVFTSTRKTYSEVTFRSRTGFKIGASFDPDQCKWVAFTQLAGDDDNSNVLLETEDFGTLLILVEKARTLIKP